MKGISYFLSIIVLLGFVGNVSAGDEGVLDSEKTHPEHYFNAPEKINTTPDFAPGAYDMPEVHDAKTYFQVMKNELVSMAATDAVFTIGTGEIIFSIAKNETKSVLGYFRNYIGIAQVEDTKVKGLKLVIDLNSLDTAVAGRNNRIRDIFFQTMIPEKGTAIVEFLDIDMDGANKGVLKIGEVSVDIMANLDIQKEGVSWKVMLKDGLDVLVSDLNMGDNIYKLMESCNHASMGNRVTVKSTLYLR